MNKKKSVFITIILCTSLISTIKTAAPASFPAQNESIYQPQPYEQSVPQQNTYSGGVVPSGQSGSYQGSVASNSQGYSGSVMQPGSYTGKVPGMSYSGTIPSSSTQIIERINSLKIARDQLSAQIAEFNTLILRRDRIDQEIADLQKDLSRFSGNAGGNEYSGVSTKKQYSNIREPQILIHQVPVGQEIK